MGTPGDRTKLKEVVRKVSTQQAEPEQEQVVVLGGAAAAATGAAPTPATTSHADSSLAHLALEDRPPPSAGTTMTILGALPQFTALADTAIKVETEGLEQAHIEHYFAQSKFYSGTAPELLAQPFVVDIHKLQKQPKTFLSLAQPGPSGLQAAATRTIKIAPKRTKKQQQQQQQQPQPTSPQPATLKRPHHVCPVCQKLFANATKLAKHQLAHNGNSPYKCEHCKKSFSSKFKLVRHVLIHSDCKPFSCSVCERTFHRKDHLKNHIKVHNPSKKHYVCAHANCNKEYTSLLSYKKHAALHAAEAGSLECQICGKTFATKEEILFHLKIHAGSRTVKSPNEKKFTCDHCDRRFFTRKDVRRHLVVHTGKRDFLCQFCPQRFGRKDHLVRHIKKSHAKNFPLKAERTETATTTVTTTTVKMEIPESSIKAEAEETTTSSSSDFPAPQTTTIPALDEVATLFFPATFEPFAQPQLDASCGSEEELAFAQPALDELGGDVLEQIVVEEVREAVGEVARATPEPALLEEPGGVLIHSEDIMRLLQTTDDANIPLPGFSQTFQTAAQPPPPPPPHSD